MSKYKEPFELKHIFHLAVSGNAHCDSTIFTVRLCSVDKRTDPVSSEGKRKYLYEPHSHELSTNAFVKRAVYVCRSNRMECCLTLCCPKHLCQFSSRLFQCVCKRMASKWMCACNFSPNTETRAQHDFVPCNRELRTVKAQTVFPCASHMSSCV